MKSPTERAFGDYDQDNVPNSVIPQIARIQQYKTEVGFKTLVEGVEDNLYVIPNFQRVYRWDFEKVNSLAVSLYMGLPIPPIYVYRNENNQFEILDGQQRVISLYLYYHGIFTKHKRNNQLQLKNIGRSNKKFGTELRAVYEMECCKYEMNYDEGDSIKTICINYDQLDEKIKRVIDYTSLTVIEININSQKHQQKLLCKIFANLNAGGIGLTHQELRNGIYQCSFYDMILDFNESNTKWRKIYGNVDKYSRDVEFLIRFCALKYFMTYVEGKFHLNQFKTYTKLLDDFSDICQNFDDCQIDKYRLCLEGFLAIVPEDIPKKIILWESLFVITDKTGFNKKISLDKCKKIENDKIYKGTVSNGTTKVDAIEKRLNRVYEIIQ